MARRLTPELMDAPDVPRDELANALSYLRWVNRRLGGASALISHLQRWSKHWPKDRPITLLDVATGSADIPLAAVAWARSRGFDLRVTGVDNHEATLELAREHVAHEPAITIEHVDALRLRDRFTSGSFDYVHAALFLHHLSDIRALTALAAMGRLARAGVVWSDLVRSRLHRAAVQIACIGQPHIVRHDARVSFEAGFTRNEALDMARRCELPHARYHHFPLWYRFTLTSEMPGAWQGASPGVSR